MVEKQHADDTDPRTDNGIIYKMPDEKRNEEEYGVLGIKYAPDENMLLVKTTMQNIHWFKLVDEDYADIVYGLNNVEEFRPAVVPISNRAKVKETYMPKPLDEIPEIVTKTVSEQGYTILTGVSQSLLFTEQPPNGATRTRICDLTSATPLYDKANNNESLMTKFINKIR